MYRWLVRVVRAAIAVRLTILGKEDRSNGFGGHLTVMKWSGRYDEEWNWEQRALRYFELL